MMEIGEPGKEQAVLLLDRVECGEEIIITHDGKPIARLVPNSNLVDRSEIRAALDRICARARRKKIKFDWKTLKADRDSGRP